MITYNDGEADEDVTEAAGATILTLSINVVQSPPFGLEVANVSACEVEVGVNVALELIQVEPVIELTEKMELVSMRTHKLLLL